MKYTVTKTRAGWNVILTVEAHEYPNGFYVTDGEVCVRDRTHSLADVPAHDRTFPSRVAECAALALRDCGPCERIIVRPKLYPKPFRGGSR